MVYKGLTKVGFKLNDKNQVEIRVGDNRSPIPINLFLLMASAVKTEWEQRCEERRAEDLKNGIG